MNGDLYVVGGNDGNALLGNVERASIDAFGTIAPFETVINTSLVQPRQDHESFAIGNQLYVLRGVNGPLAMVNNAEAATINADGSLGEFQAVADVAFVSPRRLEPATVVIENYLYAFGGFGPYGTSSSIERAAISAEGTLGAFDQL